MVDIADIISAASLTERTATVCVAGGLVAEHEELERRLKNASAQPASMAEKSERLQLAEQITELQDRMKEFSFDFRFRGLSHRKWSDLIAAHPPREAHKEMWNGTTFPPALLSACSIEPPMTVERAAELLDKLTMGQANSLFETALAVNTGKLDVPFSASAFATLRSTAEK